jgi:threonine synthase
VVLEPHGAVGWAGLQQYVGDDPSAAEALTVCLETAHPAKFPEEVRALIGVDPEAPPSLAGLETRREEYDIMKAEYEPFRDLLVDRFAGGRHSA